MVTYKLKKDAKSTDSERESLKKAKSMPVIYDDDSPEMSSVSFLWRYLIHSNRFFQSSSPVSAMIEDSSTHNVICAYDMPACGSPIIMTASASCSVIFGFSIDLACSKEKSTVFLSFFPLKVLIFDN